MKNIGKIIVAALIAILSPSATAQTGEGPDRKALFGELHMHTGTPSLRRRARRTRDGYTELA
jgi:hypothetical protein